MRNSIRVMALVAIISSCGPSEREKMISTTFAATNAARDGFITFDAAHQADILAHAGSEVEADKALADYRAKRVKVVTLFEGVYHTLAAAAIVDHGAADITNLLAAAAQLKTALDELEGK